MAERRMFAKTIIESDIFLDMPRTAQALYFHLAMHADDDGFVTNPRTILRMTNANNGDFTMLIIKHLIIPFKSGRIAIRHWYVHNYIRKDRYKETACKVEKERLKLNEYNVYELKDIADSEG